MSTTSPRKLLDFPQPPVATQNDDGSVQLQCFVRTPEPVETKWYFGELEVKAGSRFGMELVKENQDVYKAILHIKNIDDADTGTYRCVVENCHGCGEANFNLKLTGFGAPIFLEKPTIVSRDVDNTVLMQFRAKSKAEPTVTWTKDGKNITEINNTKLGCISETNGEYRIFLELKEESGRKEEFKIICNVKNPQGELTATFNRSVERSGAQLNHGCVSHRSENEIELTVMAPRRETSQQYLNRLPTLYCEKREFDGSSNRILATSREGYVALVPVGFDSISALYALDFATDDWCPIEATGLERMSEAGAHAAVFCVSSLFLVGQCSETNANELKIQCYNFATRKATRIFTFATPALTEFIIGSTGDFSSKKEKLVYFYVLCANGLLTELCIDGVITQLKFVKRYQVTNTPPALLRSSIETNKRSEDNGCDAESNKCIKHRAFVDAKGRRLIWLGMTNGSNDSVHVLDLSRKMRSYSWTSHRIPRQHRSTILQPNSCSMIFNPKSETLACVIAAKTPETSVWTVSLQKLYDGWALAGTLTGTRILTAEFSPYGKIYYLHESSPGKHSVGSMVLGVPSLTSMTINAIIKELDPHTKRIRRSMLLEQLKSVPRDVLEILWYRTILDRGVLKHLTKGAERVGEYAKDDKDSSMLRKMAIYSQFWRRF